MLGTGSIFKELSSLPMLLLHMFTFVNIFYAKFISHFALMYGKIASDASASATFTVKGEASVQYNSDTVTFATFGFPGLYYPGLLTVGPSLVLEGYSKVKILKSYL